MPILWRSLLRTYFQTFLLCVSGFVSVLIVLRFQEIARFATSGAPKSIILFFALVQIPYILPIAIPVSCLISALLLFQRLSSSYELSALRASGLRLKVLITPFLYTGLLFSVINFAIASELTPLCRAKSKELIFDVASKNPLFILQRDSLVKFKGAYYNIGTLKDNTHAEDLLFVAKNGSTNRTTLFFAKELKVKGEMLKGKQVTLVSSVDPKKGQEGFDHLVIENQEEMQVKASELSQFLQKIDWNTDSEYLTLRQLLAKGMARFNHLLLSRRAEVELSRRLSIGLAAFTFTVVGFSFGMRIGRNPSKRKLFSAILLTAGFLAAFITAKSLNTVSLIPILIFLLPHPFILLCSALSLRKIRRGIE